MTHSRILRNDGGFILRNDGGYVLLNAEGATHGSSGGGIFTRMKQIVIPQDETAITEFSKMLILRPYLLREFVRNIISERNIFPILKSLSIRIASKPIYGIALIKAALKLDSPKSFDFKESTDDWKNAGIEREKSFNLTSSFVGKVTYTPESNTLEITLNGQVYGFCRVPERIYDSFKGASSKGAFFTRIIKGQFDC